MLTTNLGQPPNPFLFDCQLTTIEGCPTLASFARVGTTNLYRSFRCGVEADDSHPFANNAKGWGTRPTPEWIVAERRGPNTGHDGLRRAIFKIKTVLSGA